MKVIPTIPSLVNETCLMLIRSKSSFCSSSSSSSSSENSSRIGGFKRGGGGGGALTSIGFFWEVGIVIGLNVFAPPCYTSCPAPPFPLPLD